MLALPASAQTPSKPAAKSSNPITVNIRTAGELAEACNASPSGPAEAARLNFCNGFAQGVIQTERQHANGAKFCFPSPAPKRSETMKEFAAWVGADATRKDQVASAAFLRFMTGRFPCK
jgi:hypothetical protein